MFGAFHLYYFNNEENQRKIIEISGKVSKSLITQIMNDYTDVTRELPRTLLFRSYQKNDDRPSKEED